MGLHLVRVQANRVKVRRRYRYVPTSVRLPIYSGWMASKDNRKIPSNCLTSKSLIRKQTSRATIRRHIQLRTFRADTVQEMISKITDWLLLLSSTTSRGTLMIGWWLAMPWWPTDSWKTTPNRRRNYTKRRMSSTTITSWTSNEVVTRTQSTGLTTTQSFQTHSRL